MFNNLKAEMARNGIEVNVLAKELGISRVALSSRINGRTEFKMTEVNKILEMFPNLTFEYLFERGEQKGA